MNRRTFQLDQLPSDPPAANPPRDLAGYPDEARLAQGYRESSAEAKKWRDIAIQQQQQLESMQSQRPEITRRPEDRLAEFGIPADALDELVTNRIQKAFEPITRSLTARTQVLAEYPDYSKFEADVASFIAADPRLNQTYQNMFQVDPAGALEFGILKFGQHRQRQSPNGAAPDMQAEAANAQLPSSRVGDGRNPALAETERLAQAFERYRQTGRPDDFIKARLRQAIPDSFFER